MIIRRAPTLALLLIASVGSAGCELIEGIFKIGFWAGIILLVLVILAIWLIVRMFD